MITSASRRRSLFAPDIVHRLRVPMVAAFSAVSLFATQRCMSSQSLPSQSEVVLWLRHQEDQVRSAKFHFREVVLPTPIEWIPLIKVASTFRRGPGSESAYIVTEEQARAMSYERKWFRSGSKEYCETRNLDSSSTNPTVYAFDGEVVRVLHTQDGQLMGAISTPAKQHWLDSDRDTPYDFFYYFMGDRLSGIVERGSGYSVDSVLHDGRPMTQVSVAHSTRPGFRFVLSFDERRLLTRNDIYRPEITAPTTSSLYHRIDLSDYKAWDDPSGETVWYPYRIESVYFVGATPDGREAPWRKSIFHIESAEFNSDVPDSTFVLGFPPGVRVWDDITGLGWIGDGGPQTGGSPVASRSWVQWVFLLGNILVVGVLVAFVVVRRRRSQGLAPDTTRVS